MHFDQSPEFEKELKKLSKKYRSLPKDIRDLEEVLVVSPTGLGKNFTIVHSAESVKIVKVRLACESLRDRTIRVVYAYHDDTFEFMYIEFTLKEIKKMKIACVLRNI